MFVKLFLQAKLPTFEEYLMPTYLEHHNFAFMIFWTIFFSCFNTHSKMTQEQNEQAGDLTSLFLSFTGNFGFISCTKINLVPVKLIFSSIIIILCQPNCCILHIYFENSYLNIILRHRVSNKLVK